MVLDFSHRSGLCLAVILNPTEILSRCDLALRFQVSHQVPDRDLAQRDSTVSIGSLDRVDRQTDQKM